ncbi:MAG TPA: glycosyltransferase [Planctomycetaceae bacterium]|nr:glycosyltransferase [Planctomycetaceae bacterium]
MTPEVSVVIPTYRRPDCLQRCLAALRQQDLELDRFEVLIADDAAEDSTRRLVETHSAQGGAQLRYIPILGTHGPAAARNAGWRAARADIVAFTDDDCIPDPRWLRAGLAEIQRGADAVAGKVVMPLSERPTDYERDAAGLATSEFVTANCFCRRSALALVGGFDERFTAAWREDSDLQFSLLERGRRIGRAGDAVVVHPVREARWGVSLAQQRKSQFNALLYKKHPALYRQRLPPFPRDYYLIDAALAVAAAAAIVRGTTAAMLAAGAWGILTGWLCLKRMRHNSRSPRHVAEMLLTSILIPPLSLYWHFRGMWRFRAFFA